MKNCPDCKGELESGALVDFTRNGVLVQRYGQMNVPEGPQSKFLFSGEGNIKNLRRVIAHRCTQCNRIFQYAQDKVIIEDFYSYNSKMILTALSLVIIVTAMVVFIIIFFAQI